MKKECRAVFGIISKNWSTLLYFEMIYKSVGYLFVFPGVRYLMSLLPGWAGVSYLSQENIGKLLGRPLAVLLVAVMLAVSALFVILELAAFFVVAEKGWRNEKITLAGVARQSAVKTAGLLRPRKIGVFLMLPVLMLSVFSLVSVYLKAFRVPDFILEFIQGNKALSVLYPAVLVCFNILLFLYALGLPSLFLGDRSFAESWRESIGLLRRRKLRFAGKAAVYTGVFLSSLLVLAAGAVLILGILTRILYSETEGRQVMELYLTSWVRIAAVVGGTLAAAFICAITVFFYHEYREEDRPEAASCGRNFWQSASRMAGIMALAVILMYWADTDVGGNIFSGLDRPPLVIAHRAGAAMAPENTLAALENAVLDGADAAEIDVQQLRDGTLVVMHDSNFKRTTGVDLNAGEADYETVKGLNAAAYLGQGKEQETVATLEEFLQRAGGNIRLMIELKSGTQGLEEETLRLVQEYGLQKSCIIASMDMDILKRIKDLEPAVETVYITAVLITSQYDLGYVDGYSVETMFLTPEMAAQAGFQGKKIYGWTANSEHSIRKVIRCGADGVITDNPALAAYCVERYGTNLLVEELSGLFY